MLSLALEPKSNPPASFFGTLRELQMEVAAYFKDKYTVYPSTDMVVWVVDEISQEQWTVGDSITVLWRKCCHGNIHPDGWRWHYFCLAKRCHVTFFASFANDVCPRTVGKIKPKFLIVETLLPKHRFSHFNILCLVFNCLTRLDLKDVQPARSHFTLLVSVL